MPDVEPLAPLMAPPFTTALVETCSGDGVADARVEPAPTVASSVMAPDGPDTAASGAVTEAMREAERLRGVALACWQDHVERTVTTGRAIMVSRSPHAVARLQMSYLQSSFASGIAHASVWARLSAEIARGMLRRS